MRDRRQLTGFFVAAITALALWAPIAQAAPPANDDFANRETLAGSLPIEVDRSNVEATQESGEFLGGLSPAGHSVWFEWEAPSSDWFTVGACQSDFPELIGIFTGTAVNALTKVVNGNASEGPHCLFSGREYTFEAEAGTKYEIAVDGNGFYVETPPPTTVGTFSLQIEATPPPANDDFAGAALVAGTSSEEPDGNRTYFAHLGGYNWNATKQGGEQDHAGDPGGASVWYRWTAPESGTVHIGTCCGASGLLALYTGSSLGALTPVASASGFPSNITAAVTGGTEYHLAVDGPEDGSSGEAAMFGFQLQVSMQLAPGPGERVGRAPDPPTGDVLAPQTTILGRTIKPGKRQASFNFSSSEAGGGFRCQLDKRPLAACNPPKTYSHLGYGKHVFRVAAVDSAGNTDPSAAVARFSISKPKPRHRSAH